MTVKSGGLEYEFYWTKYETDEDSPDAYVPGVTQHKFKPRQLDRIKSIKDKDSNASGKMKVDKDVVEMQRSKPALKDLCPADKKRIANLIRELAKTGREKDDVTTKLTSEREKHKSRARQSHEQLKTVEKERDTVRQQYMDCQLLLAEYQEQVVAEQQKLVRAAEREKLSIQANEVAAKEQQEINQQAAENRRLTDAAIKEVQDSHSTDTRLTRQYGDHLATLQRRVDSRQFAHTSKLNHEKLTSTTNDMRQEFNPVQFNPSLTSTNRSQHTTTHKMSSGHKSTMPYPSHAVDIRDTAEHWLINDVTDPRGLTGEFHVLEPQLDESPGFVEECTPLSPVERQAYADSAPRYRQNYERMTPEQRRKELMLQREKLFLEQGWLRKKLEQQEQLLQQRQLREGRATEHPSPSSTTLLAGQQNKSSEWHTQHQTHISTNYPPNNFHEDVYRSNRSTRETQCARPREISEDKSLKFNPRDSGGTLQYRIHQQEPYTRSSCGKSSPFNSTQRTTRSPWIHQAENHSYVTERNAQPHILSKQSQVATNTGSTVIFMDRETQTIGKHDEQTSIVQTLQERKIFDVDKTADQTHLLDNRSSRSLKDIIDAVENIHLETIDPPHVQRKIISPHDPSRNMFPSPDVYVGTTRNEDEESIEECQILQDIFFLK